LVPDQRKTIRHWSFTRIEWNAKVVETGRRVEDQQLPERRPLHFIGQALHAVPAEGVLGATIGKARDHATQ
jgi:hypothetical protein